MSLVVFLLLKLSTSQGLSDEDRKGSGRSADPLADPIPDFDLLNREKPFIYHRYATQVSPSMNQCFYIYAKETYQLDVKIQSKDNSKWPKSSRWTPFKSIKVDYCSALFRSPNGDVLKSLNLRHDNGQFSTDELTAGYQKLCVLNRKGLGRAIVVDVEIVIKMSYKYLDELKEKGQLDQAMMTDTNSTAYITKEEHLLQVKLNNISRWGFYSRLLS